MVVYYLKYINKFPSILLSLVLYFFIMIETTSRFLMQNKREVVQKKTVFFIDDIPKGKWGIPEKSFEIVDP